MPPVWAADGRRKKADRRKRDAARKNGGAAHVQGGYRERRKKEAENNGEIRRAGHLAVGLGKVFGCDQLRHDAALDGAEESALRGQEKENGLHRPCAAGAEGGEGEQQQSQFGPFDGDNERALAVAVRQGSRPIRKEQEGDHKQGGGDRQRFRQVSVQRGNQINHRHHLERVVDHRADRLCEVQPFERVCHRNRSLVFVL